MKIIPSDDFFLKLGDSVVWKVTAAVFRFFRKTPKTIFMWGWMPFLVTTGFETWDEAFSGTLEWHRSYWGRP